MGMGIEICLNSILLEQSSHVLLGSVWAVTLKLVRGHNWSDVTGPHFVIGEAEICRSATNQCILLYLKLAN